MRGFIGANDDDVVDIYAVGMPDMPPEKQIDVVGAVIIRNALVLCAQRGRDDVLDRLWEFPGGKIEVGETPAEALEREIREELDCDIVVGEEIITTTYEYDFGIVALTTFYCELIMGTPKLTEHVELRWLPRDELAILAWAPADLPTVELVSRIKA